MSGYDDTDDPGRPGPRWRRRGHGSRRRRIAGWLAVLVTVAVTGTSLVAYAAYLGTLHSIETFNASNLGKRPPVYNSSTNILVVGSDSRAGSNKHFGANVQGQRSDTMLILHIRPHNKGAVVISLPRDTMVPVLACKSDGLGDPGQPAQPGNVEMLNASFAYGGPPCLWKTIEQTTGIRIDHYVGLTFTGFEKVINDVGGVRVCVPFTIHDPKSGLSLKAGEHHVWGTQALAFWRERYVGQGSDLQRIERQQYLMAGLMQEVKSGQLLSNYSRMYSVLVDAAKNLTTDQGLSLTDMVSLAGDLRKLTTQSVRFVTVPNVPYPADPNRVIWQQPQASQLFRAIEHDTSLPKAGKKTKTQLPTVLATTSPANVSVEVLNGNGVYGAAGQAATELTSKGFHVTGATSAANFNYADSYIEYSSSAQLPEVNTLKAELSSVRVEKVASTSLTPGSINLIIGSAFHGLAASPSSSSSASPGSSKSSSGSAGTTLSNSYGGISAANNICKNSSAFSGPDNPSHGT
jgi:LCP family protein required for cell wall assembly